MAVLKRGGSVRRRNACRHDRHFRKRCGCAGVLERKHPEQYAELKAGTQNCFRQ
ncbi:hypothetical protein KCP71_02945 [Salmonella enterica subsp. enterica]|nr:hypothetical protein KCP71_02945 [Salmonella enterica subsp. enterica]